MDKCWIQKGDIHILLYTPYYNEEEFARIMWDSERETGFAILSRCRWNKRCWMQIHSMRRKRK